MTNDEMVATWWRHAKRGGLYLIIGVGQLQCPDDWYEVTGPRFDPGFTPLDNTEMVLYQGEGDRAFYCRPKAQFLDGRFVQISGGIQPIE